MIQANGIVAVKANGSSALLPPAAQVPITIRVGTLEDLPFIDRLQKMHSKQLGFFPRAQMEGYLKNGWVLVAWASRPCAGSTGETPVSREEPIGYIASRDRYQKRDELGAIYQLCVDPNAQRKFVGAALLKAVFDRASYGCRLFCCWCAQDLAANRFWESMGFVPLAFRAGSEKKSRVHIFWQKRIRPDDVSTPWWFPSKTEGGSIREDRIVLPIPPGTHWSEAKPLILPGMEEPERHKRLPAKKRGKDAHATMKGKTAVPITKVPRVLSGGLNFTPAPITPEATVPIIKEKPQRKPKAKADPRLIAAARELRDRWLEQVNDEPMIGDGKYDLVRKELPSSNPMARELPRLAA